MYKFKWPLLVTVLLFLVACGPAANDSGIPDETSAVSEAEEPTPAPDTISPTEETLTATPTVEDTSGLAAPTVDREELLERYAEYELVTLLPPDAIPSIDDPEFISLTEADEAYDPDELIIGVEFNGQARAYSVPLLSNHEIVNDEIDGIKFAVTW